MVSVTLAVAAAVPTTRLSKLPPVAEVMVAVRLDASTLASAALPEAIVSVPLVLPLLIVMSP